MKGKYTKESAIKKCVEVHGDKYDYSLMEYINTKTKFKIICKKHGVFEKSLIRHTTEKRGCPDCTKERMNNYDHNLIVDVNYSYLIGLFQTDGHMRKEVRNRGNITLSLSIKDEDIIYKINDIIPYNSNISTRRRKTSFQRGDKVYNYDVEIIEYRVCNKYFRDFLEKNGVPYGKKSKLIKPPQVKILSKVDYIRGLFDGDGSLGITGKGLPFVSFVSESGEIVDYILNFISEITGKEKKSMNKNKRDNIYNIVIFKEDAIIFCEKVYYDGCLSLDRKYEKSQEIRKWIRPLNMIKISNQKL